MIHSLIATTWASLLYDYPETHLRFHRDRVAKAKVKLDVINEQSA